ncbi:MAG TPA: DUF2141 domain-containing protein [Sphingomicrobium sp.]
MPLLATSLLALWLGSSSPVEATVELEVQGLRNVRGKLHLCATRNPAHFPDCRRDPAAYRRTVPASNRRIRLTSVVPGRYAISLFHDQNSNEKLDTFLGVPREGFAFSRNPVIRFGAPKFDSVGIELVAGFTRTTVRMQYLL